jgi:hypothetical protein
MKLFQVAKFYVRKDYGYICMKCDADHKQRLSMTPLTF